FPHGLDPSKGVAMKATLTFLGALLLAAAASTSARAQAIPWCQACPPTYRHYPAAPDACGPGGYCVNAYGGMYGPNYNLRPPFPPVGGLPPFPPGACAKQIGFPTHPYARSPRDFFMCD